MKRCDANSWYFSSVNGFRVCFKHLAKLDAASKSVIHGGGEMVGRCDMPIETREEFFERMAK